MDISKLPEGPAYTITSPTLEKYRRAARKGGLSALSREERDAYAAAIEKAVRAAQRASLQRELPSHRCNCASGTFHNTGEAIHKAVQAQQRAALLACKSRIATMEPDKVRELYEQAMSEKRARIAQEEARCKPNPQASLPMKLTAKPSRTTTTARRASAGNSSTRSNDGRGSATRRRATA